MKKIIKYRNKRGKLLYCPCRKVFLHHTPEEEIRQKVLAILIEEMGIPADSIDTEYPLSQFNPQLKTRADIIVWQRDRMGNEKPLLVLEVKAAHIPLTDHALEQVRDYNQTIQAKYIGTTNGNETYLFEEKEGELLPLADEFYSYKRLIEGQVTYISYQKMKRIPYNLTTYDRYVNFLRNEGYIGEGTPEKLHPFIAELQNYLLTGQITIQDQQISIVEDLGCGIFSFGNAAGGAFTGYYRSLILKDLDRHHKIYRIGIFGTAATQNDPVLGNRSGNTTLNVAIEDMGTGSFVLQLNIDQFIVHQLEDQTYHIYHNGRRNGYKNSEVIAKVEKHGPYLIKQDKIYLGSLPANRTITEKDASLFISNLILYANVHEKLRKKRKKKKQKRICPNKSKV
ncbi:hypothetical protein JOC78_003466 [Bacillus ectoiniformans]|uniref:type I restriction enzyme HsdR N-terminal domain-containing protein n=1 Tax=Bacillus ectoiniformans TaxID=1494429 RepID=UPI0019591FFD|nr:type I restriction enzyme HsdR N-terminal domain-containing protein [Bacillus ectoiniformans]MBM7650474.1 hypothetical protein [Bacillus ectoiniformans]